MQIEAQIKKGTEYFLLKRNILFANWAFNRRFTEAKVPNAWEGERLSATRAV